MSWFWWLWLLEETALNGLVMPTNTLMIFLYKEDLETVALYAYNQATKESGNLEGTERGVKVIF